MYKTITRTDSSLNTIASGKLAAISSILIGGIFIYLIGFANIDAVHNAAHDTRHSAAFPCH
ncbi:MAG: CbtB-domain containing protein [Rickettsiales bacterium]